jgi:superfamily II DNA/RNA helicase
MVCYEEVCSRLAWQVAPKLDAVLLIGGVPAGPQERALKTGVDIVTGTPGEGHWQACCCS